MSARRENSRKASGLMHILPLASSSSPIGHAQIGPLGAGLLRQRWLHPLSFREHALLPRIVGRVVALVHVCSHTAVTNTARFSPVNVK